MESRSPVPPLWVYVCMYIGVYEIASDVYWTDLKLSM